MAARVEAQRLMTRKQKKHPNCGGGICQAGEVPRELKNKFKKAKAAKGLLQDLEERVRHFVNGWESEKKSVDQRSQLHRRGNSVSDLSDEEIVFVGRNGKMRDIPASPKFRDGEDSASSDSDLERISDRGPGRKPERLIFDSLVNDRSASFGRWLVHNLAAYYGLRTWSRTVGDRREAYVGLPPRLGHLYGRSSTGDRLLPHPLWRVI